MVAAPASVRPESISPALREVLAAIHDVLPDASLVGGAVRDLLQGRQPVDLDVISGTDVRPAAEALAARLGGSHFALDEERGQYRVAVKDRTPVKSIDLSAIAGDIEADLRRRDFTINAVAASILTGGGLGELLDPTAGVPDLQAKLIRMTDRRALREDPLRLLRAVRIAIELGFEIEAQTAARIRELAPLLPGTAAERQREELVRILATTQGAAGVRLMDGLGLLAQLLPELEPARGLDQPGGHHHWDVFDHSVETLATLDALLSVEPPAGPRAELRRVLRGSLNWFPLDAYLDADAGGHSRRVLLKLAGLLHDNAKPETRTIDAEGNAHFYGHPEQGAQKAARICERLRFSNRETRFVSLLVEEHLRPTQLAAKGQAPSQRALYRFFRDLGDAAPACLVLMLADGAATAGPRLTPDGWQRHVAYAAYVLSHGKARLDAVKANRLVSGDDLMAALGLAPGAELGRVLAAVEEAIGAGEVSTRDEALEYARRLIAAEPPATGPDSPSPSTERGQGERFERR
jgi:poly(A) polymerase